MKKLKLVAAVIFLAGLFCARAHGGEEEPKPPSDTKAETETRTETTPARPAPSESAREVLARLDDEPGLEQLKRAALRLADADRESTRGWMRATNLAALLPTVKLVAEHDMERDESLDRYQDEPDRWGADTDRDLGFQVSAQWRLDELVFNPDEVRVYSALASRAARREALLTVLIGYYFERQKLLATMATSPPADRAGRHELEFRVRELTALIDALTGGLLSRNLR